MAAEVVEVEDADADAADKLRFPITGSDCRTRPDAFSIGSFSDRAGFIKVEQYFDYIKKMPYLCRAFSERS